MVWVQVFSSVSLVSVKLLKLFILAVQWNFGYAAALKIQIKNSYFDF